MQEYQMQKYTSSIVASTRPYLILCKIVSLKSTVSCGTIPMHCNWNEGIVNFEILSSNTILAYRNKVVSKNIMSGMGYKATHYEK